MITTYAEAVAWLRGDDAPPPDPDEMTIPGLPNMLPADFDGWSMADSSGQTVAHVAAEMGGFAGGGLPDTFTDWHLTDNAGRTVAEAAWERDDAKQWCIEHIPSIRLDMSDSSGWTVAHEVASYGIGSYEAAEAASAGSYAQLPADFNGWDMANSNGWTVAHSAASSGSLPAEFTQWSMADKDGTTVAHVAWDMSYDRTEAEWDIDGMLKSFSHWDLADNNGWTVAHEATKHGVVVPEEAIKAILDKGKTSEKRLLLIKENYPELYNESVVVSSLNKPISAEHGKHKIELVEVTAGIACVVYEGNAKHNIELEHKVTETSKEPYYMGKYVSNDGISTAVKITKEDNFMSGDRLRVEYLTKSAEGLAKVDGGVIKVPLEMSKSSENVLAKMQNDMNINLTRPAKKIDTCLMM
jgi:hypothetical protein